jgi:hypothetical protein
MLAQPKAFSTDPLQTVAHHGIAGGVHGDRQSQAGVVQPAPAGQHDPCGIALTVTLGTHGSELACASQSARRRESPLFHKPVGSDSQAVAAFGASGLDYQSAVLVGHPGTKSMRAFAMQFAGLKGSFHGVNRCSGK